MSTEQWIALLLVALVILSATCAGVLLAQYGVLAFYTALELYFGKVKELEEKLEKSQLQEQRGAENYQTLGDMYDRLADKYREQGATVNQQADLIKSLRNKEPGQALVEYALKVLFVAIAIIAIFGGIGAIVYGFFVKFVGAVPWVY